MKFIALILILLIIGAALGSNNPKIASDKVSNNNPVEFVQNLFKSPTENKKATSKKGKQTPTQKRLGKMKDYKKFTDKYRSGVSAFDQKPIDDPKFLKSILVADEAIEGGIRLAEDCTQKIAKKDPTSELCKKSVKKAFGRAKASYRYMKFQAIMAGRPGACVEADLGQKPHLYAKGITKIKEKDKDNPKETGQSKLSRLFLCSGKDGKIKWRIIYPPKKLFRITEEYTKKLGLTLDPNNLATKEHIEATEKLLGIN